MDYLEQKDWSPLGRTPMRRWNYQIPKGWSKKNKNHPERRCECGTKLSIYNKGKVCGACKED